MANTKVSFTTYEGENLKSYLVGQVGSAGTPNISGYTTTDVLDPGLYLFTVPENLVGEFSVKALDSSSGVVFRGYVTLANDTNTYRCYDYTNSVIDGGPGGPTTGSIVFPVASLPDPQDEYTFSLFKSTDWNFSISGVGQDSDEFYFTMKSVNTREDSEADLQINTNGTTYIKQEPYSTNSGTLTYTSGTINISVQAEVTDLIPGGRKYHWDIKGINETTVRSFGFIEVKIPTTRQI